MRGGDGFFQPHSGLRESAGVSAEDGRLREAIDVGRWELMGKKNLK